MRTVFAGYVGNLMDRLILVFFPVITSAVISRFHSFPGGALATRAGCDVQLCPTVYRPLFLSYVAPLEAEMSDHSLIRRLVLVIRDFHPDDGRLHSSA